MVGGEGCKLGHEGLIQSRLRRAHFVRYNTYNTVQNGRREAQTGVMAEMTENEDTL